MWFAIRENEIPGIVERYLAESVRLGLRLEELAQKFDREECNPPFPLLLIRREEKWPFLVFMFWP